MISTMGYPSNHVHRSRISMGIPSPLKLQSSLFVSTRRPSIPLFPGLLPAHPSLPGTCIQLNAGVLPRAPVHLLPVEVLCDIFAYCESHSTRSKAGMKVIISHVCRRWRSIILCMPLLWTSVHTRNPAPHTVDQFLTFVRRSANCPISVTIISDLNLSRGTPPELASLWNVIRSHSRQVKSLRLELRGALDGLLRCLEHPQFPILEELDLRLRNCSSADTISLLSSLQKASPISSFSWSGDTLPASTRWSHLVTIRLNGAYSLHSVCHILSQCREARDVSVDTISDAYSSQSAELALPHLHTLSISTLVPPGPIFRNLSAPNLRALNIRYHLQKSSDRSWNLLGDMLLRSLSSLEILVFSDLSLEEEALLEYLRLPMLQHVRELHLRQPIVTDALLDALKSSELLPALQFIHVSNFRTVEGIVRSVSMSHSSTTRTGLRVFTH